MVIGLASAVGAPAVADSVYVEHGSSAGNAGRGTWVTLAEGLTFWDGTTQRQVWAGESTLFVDGFETRSFSAQLTDRDEDGWFEQRELHEVFDSYKAQAVRSLFASQPELRHREDVVAFQAMLWEIVYDFDGTEESLDLESGAVSFRGVHSGRFVDMRTGVLRGGDDVHVVIVEGPAGNDNFRIVPLPSSAAMAGLGLLSVSSTRRRRSH